MEQKWKICLACTSDAIEGCDNLTEEAAQEWLAVNQEYLDAPNECGDLTKYVVLAIDPVE